MPEEEAATQLEQDNWVIRTAIQHRRNAPPPGE